MKWLIAESYSLLLWVGAILAFRNLHVLCKQVQNAQTKVNQSGSQRHAEELCRAMELACVFFPTQVLCLQRSAATTLLLRRHGIRAELVIGAQLMPFRSHAWVESDGTVVNDKPYMREIYQVLEHC